MQIYFARGLTIDQENGRREYKVFYHLYLRGIESSQVTNGMLLCREIQVNFGFARCATTIFSMSTR